MEEQRADNSGTGETDPNASRGRFIAPTADLSARGPDIVPTADPNAGRGRFIVPTADLSARGTRFNLPAHGQSLSQPPIAPQSLESISDEAFWKHAREQAEIKSNIPSTEGLRPQQYLECRLSCGAFLIPLQTLCEVMPAPHHYTLLPNIPGWMLGITQYSGSAIAVVDLDAYLCDLTGRTGSTPSTGTLLVANNADLTVGLFIHPNMLVDKQVYDEQNMPSVPVIDMSMLLANVVQQIGIAAYHG